MSKTKLLVYSFLFLALGLGLIFIVTSVRGKIFYLELLGLFCILIGAVVGYLGFKPGWGERVFFIVFFFSTLNVVLLWSISGEMYAVLLLVSVVGFLLALPQKKVLSRKPAPKPIEPYSEVFEPEKKSAAATFTPGKYVASKMSNTYHEPKCEWAKKIAKSRRIWFGSKEEAWEKKYKAHGCVQ